MTSMDIVYVGLIVLSALVFYCHGFFSGVKRARGVYESLLGNADSEQTAPSTDDEDWPTPTRQTGLRLPPSRGREVRGDFGDN